MPSFQIHLAVAKRYVEKHNVKDIDKFLEGSVAPDFQSPKEKSHYTIPSSRDDLVEHLKCKVDIDKFLEENEIKTDYDKGVLLHLLTDKLFFTEFFDEDYLRNVTYDEFCENLYNSYGMTNNYLNEKYSVKVPKELEEKMNENIQQSMKERKIKVKKIENILPLEKLDAFIENVSDIDIEKYYKK